MIHQLNNRCFIGHLHDIFFFDTFFANAMSLLSPLSTPLSIAAAYIEVAAKADKFGKQIKHADRRGIPYVWFPDTAGDTVKDIRTGEQVAAGYLNLYICNRAVIVPVSNADTDDDALALIGAAFPGREVVPVPGTVLAYGGGGPHCITQQVPVAVEGTDV